MRETGLKADNILLPVTDDLGAWACIACDQFTSEKDYWTELETKVGDKKSTLKLQFKDAFGIILKILFYKILMYHFFKLFVSFGTVYFSSHRCRTRKTLGIIT